MYKSKAKKKKQDQKKVLHIICFLNSFYEKLENYELSKEENVISGQTPQTKYKEDVFKILEDQKGDFPLTNDKLEQLQWDIEKLTIVFDEKSIFRTAPDLIKCLTRNGLSAKDFLRNKLDKNDEINNELLSEFGQYTLEALIIHVLSSVFSPDENTFMVRLSTLVDQLDRCVRNQAYLLKSRRLNTSSTLSYEEKNGMEDNPKGKIKSKSEKKASKYEKDYAFGIGLTEFLEEMDMIKFTNELGLNITISNKKGQFYLEKNHYADCNFPVSYLPIRLNLPMVYPPLNWQKTCPKNDDKPCNMTEMAGGYLTSPTGEIYDRYRVLSTKNSNNFTIYISDKYDNICHIMNNLQKQAFQINSNWLQYIKYNYNHLVVLGYLLPRFLAYVSIKEAIILLRELHKEDTVINQLCSFTELVDTLHKHFHRARYERMVLNMASAYDGYQFYLPAFLDFRGRIYRCGVLHFHERDLARSLIVFSDSESDSLCENQDLKKSFSVATANLYKSFDNHLDALSFYDDIDRMDSNQLLSVGQNAKRPLQFLSNVLVRNDNITRTLPITQDASASAYQIMSYLLLDFTMAERTNLFPSKDGKIHDVYSYMLDELKEFLEHELLNTKKFLLEIVKDKLNRKIVKGIFMPMIYGKTLMSTAEDLKDHLSHFITHKECFEVAKLCFKFWKKKYQRMDCLINLIKHIGWLVSASDRPVVYSSPFFCTAQDYLIMEPINIWVYDKIRKKKRKVTLRIPTSKRDRRKTVGSTFVNFIHQKDAFIAMKVVEKMVNAGGPIYTVHDNFISTAEYCHKIPSFYGEVFREMDSPLLIINKFIYMNLIQPNKVQDEFYFSKNEIESRLDCVLPPDKLREEINKNKPDKLDKKMNKTWDERVSGTLLCYENYVHSVCGIESNSSNKKLSNKKLIDLHHQRMDDFKFRILAGIFQGKGEYHCVHY